MQVSAWKTVATNIKPMFHSFIVCFCTCENKIKQNPYLFISISQVRGSPATFWLYGYWHQWMSKTPMSGSVIHYYFNRWWWQMPLDRYPLGPLTLMLGSGSFLTPEGCNRQYFSSRFHVSANILCNPHKHRACLKKHAFCIRAQCTYLVAPITRPGSLKTPDPRK